MYAHTKTYKVNRLYVFKPVHNKSKARNQREATCSPAWVKTNISGKAQRDYSELFSFKTISILHPGCYSSLRDNLPCCCWW